MIVDSFLFDFDLLNMMFVVGFIHKQGSLFRRIGGGLQDFFLGSNIGLDPNQQGLFDQLSNFQSPFGGFADFLGERAASFRDAPALDPATAALIRAQTGAVQASTGASLAGRLAGAGTLGGGIGNQALASLSASRQSALAQGLSEAAIAGRRQNIFAEQNLLGLQGRALGQQGSQQLQALGGASGLANIGAQFQPGFLQGIAGGLGQSIGFGGLGGIFGGLNPFGGPINQNPRLLGQGFPA